MRWALMVAILALYRSCFCLSLSGLAWLYIQRLMGNWPKALRLGFCLMKGSISRVCKLPKFPLMFTLLTK